MGKERILRFDLLQMFRILLFAAINSMDQLKLNSSSLLFSRKYNYNWRSNPKCEIQMQASIDLFCS